MNKQTVVALVLLVLVCSFITGCGTIYSSRKTGPQSGSTKITKGLSKEDVVSTLGAPDFVTALDEGREMYVYHSLKYSNILGIYASVDKNDFVLVFEEGNLNNQDWTETGETLSIIGIQVLNLGINSGE